MIKFNITFSPAMSTSEFKIGIYNVDTNTPTYYTHTTTGIKGNGYIKKAGNYKFVVTNLSSSKTVALAGDFTMVSCDYFVKVDYIPQGTDWCWAASIEMCAKSLGYPQYTQRDIVIAVKGSEIHEGAKSADEYARGVKYATGGKIQQDNSIKGGDYTTTFYAKSLTSNEIKAELTAKRPIIAAFKHLTQNGGHAVVLCGYDSKTTYVKFADPNPSNSNPKYYKLSEAISNSTSIWHQTFKITINTEK